MDPEEMKMYVEGLMQAKENVVTAREALGNCSEILMAIQEESGVDFAYSEMVEAMKAKGEEILAALETDIKAFSGNEPGSATPATQEQMAGA